MGLFVMAMAVPSFAGNATVLTDEELDQVSAEGLPDILWEILPIYSGSVGDCISGMTQNGNTYTSSNGNTVFTIGDQAQQNLQALTNINAVNSAVAYLINITYVGGDLTGQVHQTNNAAALNFVDCNWIFNP